MDKGRTGVDWYNHRRWLPDSGKSSSGIPGAVHHRHNVRMFVPLHGVPQDDSSRSARGLAAAAA